MSKRLPLAGLILLSLLSGSAMTYAANADEPPQAAVRVVSDSYFGTTIADPYRWMEDAKNPEFTSWLKAQAAYASSRLERLPMREALLKRLEELSNVNHEVSGARRVGENYFYFKVAPGENDRKLYVRQKLTGVERLLVDPEKLSSDGKRYSIMAYSPSQNGRYVSYTVSAGGSEFGELRVVEVASGRDLGERIDRTRWSAGSWLPDGRSFVYWRQRKPDVGAPPTEARQRSRVYLHVLGADPDKDKPVHGYEVHPDLKMEPALFPWVWVPYGSKFVLAGFDTGVSPNYAYFIAPVATLKQPVIPWRKIADFSDEVRSIVVHDDDLYLLSYKNTPRFRILRTSAIAPDLAGAREIVPSGRAIITGIAGARDALYVQLLDGGIGRLMRVDYREHTRREIKLPYDGAIFEWNADPRRAGVLVGMHSWVRPPAYFVFDPKQDAMLETPLQPRSPIDVSAFESVEVAARSHDGTMVPLSIVYKRGLKRDGSNPTLLLGYGAYGFPLHPAFNPRSLAWLERGGVLAFAHVRGGGELGREWHTAGQKLTKPNTWKDFIACAEYLISEKYTSSPRLAGQGRSAGGILMGNAIAERPDLFAAAVINVGVMNPLRFETTANGPPNIPEFGSVKTEDGFKGLLAMDAYTKIRDGTAYPAVLLTHGINDPRVEPWLSAKMTARLQAATTSGKPVWLRIEYDAGHGFGTTKSQRNEEQADTYAFLLRQLMAPDAAVGPDFSGKPIRIVTSGAGGGNDRMARELAQALAGPLGQSITVENHQGGVAPGEVVARSQPDGHTILVYNNSLWIGPLVQNAAYDAVRDFAPIVELARTPNVVVVAADSPARTVAELIALAKAKPGALQYGTSGVGSTNHLAGELFASMAGVKMVAVAYKGSSGAIKDLMSGGLNVMFPTTVSGAPHVKAGRLRALGVTSATPSALMPGVPPVALSGLPGYESITIFGAFAPAATPRAIVGRLNSEMVQYITRADVKDGMLKDGMEVVGGAPAQLAATMKSELERMSRVIRDAGIRVSE